MFGLVVASTEPPSLGFLRSMQARGDESGMIRTDLQVKRPARGPEDPRLREGDVDRDDHGGQDHGQDHQFFHEHLRSPECSHYRQ
jgi:hypothetical protein